MSDSCRTARKNLKTASPTAVVLAVHAWLLRIQGARWIPELQATPEFLDTLLSLPNLILQTTPPPSLLLLSSPLSSSPAYHSSLSFHQLTLFLSRHGLRPSLVTWSRRPVPELPGRSDHFIHSNLHSPCPTVPVPYLPEAILLELEPDSSRAADPRRFQCGHDHHLPVLRQGVLWSASASTPRPGLPGRRSGNCYAGRVVNHPTHGQPTIRCRHSSEYGPSTAPAALDYFPRRGLCGGVRRGRQLL